MRVVYSQGKWIPAKSLLTAESYQSKTDCQDAQRIRGNSEMDSTRPTRKYVNDISKPITSSRNGMGSGWVSRRAEFMFTPQFKEKPTNRVDKAVGSSRKTKQGKWIPAKSLLTVESYKSKTDCQSAQRTRENSEMDSTRPVGMVSGWSSRRDRFTRSNEKIVANANGEPSRQLRIVLPHPHPTNRIDTSKGSSRKTKQVNFPFRHFVRLDLIRLKRCDSAVEKVPIVRDREKPFECQTCNAAFKRKDHLSRHMLIHTNEKPFACDECEKQFQRKENLSDHMNVHSGRKPHQCNVCKKAYRYKRVLNKHKKVHV